MQNRIFELVCSNTFLLAHPSWWQTAHPFSSNLSYGAQRSGILVQIPLRVPQTARVLGIQRQKIEEQEMGAVS